MSSCFPVKKTPILGKMTGSPFLSHDHLQTPRAPLLRPGRAKSRHGRRFVENSPSAHALYELADSRLGWPLSDYSFNGPEAILTETRVCQPALYATGWPFWPRSRTTPAARSASRPRPAFPSANTRPTPPRARFTFQTGLHLVAERGRLMQEACNATVGHDDHAARRDARAGAGNRHPATSTWPT
jgi:malonyl CoA-acyl carrier protein transacylase